MSHPALSYRYVVPNDDAREHLPRNTYRMCDFDTDEQSRIATLDSEVRARGCTPLCMNVQPDGSIACGTVETVPNTYGHSRFNLRLTADGNLFDGVFPIARMS
jgi:hypothetical protein